MKRLTAVLLSIVLVFGLAACSSNSDSGSQSGDAGKGKATVTMGFWGTAQELKIYQDAAASVSEKYPNMELKVKQYPSSEQFWNILPGEIAAGVAPDFIKISNEGADEYIQKGLFASLDDLIPAANIDMNRFTPSAVKLWQKDGKQYGVPNINMPAMFFINDDMWKQAGLTDYPKTWDEVQAAAKKLTSKDVHGITINLDAYHITNYVKSYGGGWGEGKTINSPENVQAMQKILDMYKDGSAVTPKSLGYGWDGEVFANGKSAMTTGGYWYKGYLKDANPNLKYTAIPVPKGTANGSTMIADAYIVLKDAKNKQAALQAAYYMTDDKIQTEFMKIGFNSSNTSLTAKFFELNPEFQAVKPALDYSTDFGYPVETKKFKDELVKQLETSVLGGVNKSPKDILDSVQQQFK
jgi:multiple sugar transport system substrate-binding protein